MKPFNLIMESFHIPVLLNESIEFLLNPSFKVHTIVDGTVGGGGYSAEICKHLSDKSKLICIDKDENALKYSKKRMKEYSEKITFVNENFGNIKKVLTSLNVNCITGLVLDLGLSLYQLGKEDGFSYLRDTSLDMRAFKKDEVMASDIVNGYTKQQLTEIFQDFGEIGNPERLARAITQKRKKKKIYTTMQLVEIVNDEYKISRKNLNKFLSKIFQALRIAVNNELENLKNALIQSLGLLTEGGRLVIVSYHSLEDRIVKNFFKEESYLPARSKYKSYDSIIGSKLKILTRKAIIPGREEILFNAKSRSAKLRAAERI